MITYLSGKLRTVEFTSLTAKSTTLEPRYYKPLYNEVLGVINDFLSVFQLILSSMGHVDHRVTQTTCYFFVIFNVAFIFHLLGQEAFFVGSLTKTLLLLTMLPGAKHKI